MADPFLKPRAQASAAPIHALGAVNQTVSTEGRVEKVMNVGGRTLAVISVGGQTFNLPVDGSQAGGMYRLKGLSVTLSITPTHFSSAVTGMGSHLLRR